MKTGSCNYVKVTARWRCDVFWDTVYNHPVPYVSIIHSDAKTYNIKQHIVVQNWTVHACCNNVLKLYRQKKTIQWLILSFRTHNVIQKNLQNIILLFALRNIHYCQPAGTFCCLRRYHYRNWTTINWVKYTMSPKWTTAMFSIFHTIISPVQSNLAYSIRAPVLTSANLVTPRKRGSMFLPAMVCLCVCLWPR